jgi:hypothetical protein
MVPIGGINGGWQRVQAICDYVHNHIEFGYHHARCVAPRPKDMPSASGLPGLCPSCVSAVSLHEYSRPLLYGLSGISACPRIPHRWILAPGSRFSSTAAGSRSMRHNPSSHRPNCHGARRDAADVAISTAFGPAQLARFNVVTEELADKDYSPRNLQTNLALIPSDDGRRAQKVLHHAAPAIWLGNERSDRASH